MIKILSPYYFKMIKKYALWPLLLLCLSCFGTGLYCGLIASPADYQQGEAVRIMYVHVPAAWMALGVYMFLGICSLLAIVWQVRLAFLLAVAAAPIGACFAAITLITGSLWGKPIWGTWWVWDARLTSMLVLFLLYLGYISVVNAGDNLFRAEKPASVIALLGVINVPIVKFSVDIWHSLHQPASVLKSGGPAIHSSMLLPLLLMFSAYVSYFIILLLIRTENLMQNLRNQ